jgi:hypothetical protein
MHFASTIWLVLLLPWAALTAWLLWVRRGTGANVPFLDLWRGPVAAARSTGRFGLPPLALFALIASMLLAVLAAARPVLSPRQDWTPPRVGATAPAKGLANVAITHVAAVDRPRAQVMVTVRNESSDRRTGSLDVRSGTAEVRRGIDLPVVGHEANYFVDLPALASRVDANLDPGDEIGADNRASLERKVASPKVEVRGDVPPEVRRVIEAYGRARPAGEGGRIVACPAGIGEGGVILAPSSGNASENVRGGRAVVAAHPVTANLDLSAVAMSISDSPPPQPAQGWKTLLSVGDKPALAARESPVRQVWIGFESRDLALSPTFVVLWTNVIEWVGETAQNAFVETVASLPRNGGGQSQATEAPTSERRERDLAPILAFCALLCVFFASLTWSAGRRLTAFSPPRTVI